MMWAITYYARKKGAIGIFEVTPEYRVDADTQLEALQKIRNILDDNGLEVQQPRTCFQVNSAGVYTPAQNPLE